MEWIIENEYSAKGYKIICGTDEAGRGPLCGNVAAGACILPYGVDIPGLNDSKKLTEKKREKLYDIITSSAIAWAVGEASPEEIDDINILQATFLAMRRAVEQLSTRPDIVLVDGNREPELGGLPVKTIVKGDSLSASIAAASILAKVTRDRFMLEQDAIYPQYGFAVHKGYGTKAHYAALTQYGACPIHRRSFLKKFYGQ